ncbi:mycofactocin biosynthesis glycosyltransferase MftF [Thermodesulfobacteriota bacterium]
MNATQKETYDVKSLSYRLPDDVHFTEKETGLYLIRENPLSTIELNSVWKPVLDILSKDNFIQFKEIFPHINASPDKTEIYLNTLVRKGFLETAGYRELDNYPSVTIIIPVRNRRGEIHECLFSLQKLDYPSEKLEVIVVDDASTDSTPDVVSGFPVRLIKNADRMHASYSRNLAAKEAKGEILAFLDSDCMAHPLWLKELVPSFSDETNGAVGGRVDSWFDIKALDRYEKVFSSLNMGERSRSTKEEGRFFYLPACNLLVKKDIFLNLDGFNIEMDVGEDVDFCWRLKNSGLEIEYRPAGRVYHRHRNKIPAFFKRRFQYGTSEPFLQKKHPDRLKKMFYLPLTILLWHIVFVSVLTGHYYLLGICGLILVVDTHKKWMRAKKKDLPIKYRQVLFAIFRGYFVSLYHWCAFFSRYYLVMAFLLFPFFPTVFLVLFINHFIISFCEFFLRKPSMNIAGFIYFFTIDQLAYQLGVWFGCFKYLSFNPVNPEISRWKS